MSKLYYKINNKIFNKQKIKLNNTNKNLKLKYNIKLAKIIVIHLTNQTIENQIQDLKKF